MTINDVYEIVQFAAKKSNLDGYITPSEFNRIINVGMRSFMSWLLGSFQTYQPGRPIALVELGQNSVVRQRLTPSIYEYNLTVDATGFSPYPGDYLQADAMWSIYGFNRIRCVQQDSWYSYYNSTIDPISANPIYRLRDIGLFFAPESIGSAKLSYVRNPPDMRWAYTEDVNGLPVYDSINSVQPIFDDLSILDIIVRALALVGVNLQSADVAQYAQMIKTQGQ